MSELKLFKWPFKAMGSYCELKLYCSSSKEAKSISHLVTDKVSQFEKKYTRFKSSSITSTININAGKRPVKIDSETAQLLHYADILFEQSNGLFDITSGVLRQAWNFKSNIIPTQETIEPLLALIGWQQVEWDQRSIRLPTKGMEIDFGGFVKEYTVDMIASLCIDNGINHGLINLGGDIRILGPHPNNAAWRVGIQHPRNSEKPIAFIDMQSGAIATSGDYERFMIVDNKRYCHLLNPKTGQSIQPKFMSVSVIGESCLIAGSFSSIAMLKSEKEYLWIDNIGLPYLSIDDHLTLSGTVNYS